MTQPVPDSAPAAPAAADSRMDDEQRVYARLLKIAARVCLAALTVTFVVYVFGLRAPHVPVNDLPRLWCLPCKQFIQVGREISDTLHSEVREKGLRRTLDAPGKFEQILSILDILVEMVEKNDFSFNMKEFLRAVYGEEPTLRGAGLYNNYFKLSEMKPGSQEFEDATE